MSTWKRAFLAAFLIVAVFSGVLGSTAGIAAQEGNETTTADGPSVPDTIALYGVAVVVAVLSPIAFAIVLALRYRGE